MKKIYYSLACCLIGGMLASCGGGAKKSNATEEAAAPTTTAVSYSKSLQNQPDVKGILEYAETEDGTKYTVKSWTNPSMIAVMYVASKKEVNINFQEIYFNGFRFKK
jgi:basic membrane lipoprotein Med (substrate-binding protein (PBP1-ABC) superfamily)